MNIEGPAARASNRVPISLRPWKRDPRERPAHGAAASDTDKKQWRNLFGVQLQPAVRWTLSIHRISVGYEHYYGLWQTIVTRGWGAVTEFLVFGRGDPL